MTTRKPTPDDAFEALARKVFGAKSHVVHSDLFEGRVYVLSANGGATLFQHTAKSKAAARREATVMLTALLKSRKGKA